MTREEQRQQAANEVQMQNGAHNKIWQDGAKWADEHPVITEEVFRELVSVIGRSGAIIPKSATNKAVEYLRKKGVLQ